MIPRVRRRFVVERECGCHGPKLWRWQVAAYLDTAYHAERDDAPIIVAYAMTRRAAKRKAKDGPERLARLYARADRKRRNRVVV